MSVKVKDLLCCARERMSPTDRISYSRMRLFQYGQEHLPCPRLSSIEKGREKMRDLTYFNILVSHG
jgi:hypothetical protein